MRPESFAFLQALAEAPSPSGYEQPAQKIFRGYIKGFVDEVGTDVLGNSFGWIKGKEKPVVMLAGHCDEVGFMIKYIDENGTIEGAPGVKPQHLPAFDCAFKPQRGTRSIHYMGHIKMMSAVQPFISGAISKTVNVPENITVEEIMETYMQAWKLGVKAIAIYRDNSKRTQPLTAGKGKSAGSCCKIPASTEGPPVEAAMPTTAISPGRRGVAMPSVWARGGVVYSAATDRIYLVTGNAAFSPASHHWGDTVLALNPDGSGNASGDPVDTYTPANFAQLNSQDLDLGSTAPAILPVTDTRKVRNLAVQGGDAFDPKAGTPPTAGQQKPGTPPTTIDIPITSKILRAFCSDSGESL